MASAYTLIPYESEAAFAEAAKKGQDWYEYLWHAMSGTFEDFWDNQVAFVTFNYDRSLEQFLHTVVVAHYSDKSEEECSCALGRFNWVHVHGTLGALPWQKGSMAKRSYGSNPSAAELSQAADSIGIVGDVHGSDERFVRARYLLYDWAERTVFLGFAYHQENLDNLAVGNPEAFYPGFSR